MSSGAVPDPREPRRCAAHNRAGQQCKRNAIPGLNVCRWHGGATQRARAAAQKRVAEAEAKEMIERRIGQPLEIPPHEALLWCVFESAGNVEVLRIRVQELQDTVSKTKLGEEQLAATVRWYNEERDRLAKFAKLAIDAGVQERQVRLQERQAQAVVDFMTRVLDDPALGLTKEQRQIGRQVAGGHLRVLAAAS
jgi:hypothetical protein